MRSAALPDLNSGYVTYRKYILTALQSQNYDLATGYLYDLNAILPDDYKVEISTIKFNEKKKEETVEATCVQVIKISSCQIIIAWCQSC